MNKLTSTELSLKIGALALEGLDDQGLSAPGTDGSLMGAAPNPATRPFGHVARSPRDPGSGTCPEFI